MSPLRNSSIYIIALIAMALLNTSAFTPVPSTTTICRDVSCYAVNNKKKSVATGIGGLNNAFKSSGSKPKTTPKKTAAVAKKAAAKAPVKKTQPTGSVFNVKMSDETPWSTILLSFLIPWRNPNSIFLYLLIIVSVLGKMNEQ